MDRRSFLKLSGLGGAASLAFSCDDQGDTLKLFYSQLVPDQVVPLGQEAWFATLCQECSAGCGILVRDIEGRAQKVEGNPLSPVNEGKTCARGQAALQGLYNPDRWQGPRRRTDGGLTETGWDEALGEVAQALSRLEKTSQHLLVVTRPMTGHLHLLFDRFTRAFRPAEWIRWEPFEDTVARRAASEMLGFDRMPILGLDRADLLVSFGCDLLGAGRSPVHYGVRYGRFRQGVLGEARSRPRGTWYHFEPRLSLTASNADRWIPVEPGWEGLVALALTRLVLERQGVAVGEAEERQRALTAVSEISVEQAESHLDARPGLLADLARRLTEASAPLAAGGGTAMGTPNGSANMRAVQLLQVVLGNTRLGGLVAPSPASPLRALPAFSEAGDGTEMDAANGFSRLEGVGRRIISGKSPTYGALLTWGVDLEHALPGSSIFRQALEQIPLRIAATPFPDDTSNRAHIVLPTSTPLETWGDGVPDPGPGAGVWALAQPVAATLYDTRAPGDVLLGLAKRLGGPVAEAMPWKDTAAALDNSLIELFEGSGGKSALGSYGQFFDRLVAQGGWYPPVGESPPETTITDVATWPSAGTESHAPNLEGDATEYPFYLLPYPSPALSSGEGANRPWLQELGDPLTSVAWGTWVEINPVTARALGVETGDEVRLETPFGSLEAPAYVYPGVRPDTIAMPAGGGHRHYGRYAQARGANVMSLLPARPEADTGALSWISTRVRLTPTGRRGELVRLEGSGRWLADEDFPV